MRAVGIKALKDRLSEYVRLVAAGETVLVTDRDRVVAELVPPRSGRAESIDDMFLAGLVRSGVLAPPAIHDGTAPPRIPLVPSSKLALDLERDRADR